MTRIAHPTPAQHGVALAVLAFYAATTADEIYVHAIRALDARTPKRVRAARSQLAQWAHVRAFPIPSWVYECGENVWYTRGNRVFWVTPDQARFTDERSASAALDVASALSWGADPEGWHWVPIDLVW